MTDDDVLPWECEWEPAAWDKDNDPIDHEVICKIPEHQARAGYEMAKLIVKRCEDVLEMESREIFTPEILTLYDKAKEFIGEEEK